MNFEQELRERTGAAERAIRRFLPREEGFSSGLAKAVNYSMLAGGKRIRPVMMQAAYELFGGRGEEIEPFMAAIEMIHTHSLVHDDLPAIDGDLYRRGKKTTHAVFGEAAGVLSGDALLNLAYETALDAIEEGTVKNSARGLGALRILAEKTGIRGMLGGQSVDVTNEKNEVYQIKKEQLDYIYRNKTSALLEASLMAGAALAGAGKTQLCVLEEVGAAAGLAFQIQDDILDVTGTAEELGKPILSDEKNHKTTYVTLLGTEGAKKEVQRLTEEAVRLLDTLPGETSFLRELLAYLALRRR